MSLLLDARKISREKVLGLEPGAPPPDEAVSPLNAPRRASQNVFQVKLGNDKQPWLTSQLRWVLLAAALLAALGAGYVWFNISSNARTVIPPLPHHNTPVESLPVSTAVDSSPAPTSATLPTTQLSGKSPRSTRTLRPPAQPTIAISHDQAEYWNKVLSDAYAAYRAGDLELAQRQYLDMLNHDAHNTDSLLGLAAIAQQRNEDAVARQYYQQVLAQDPHHPIASAGLASLSNNENHESRLKTLLAEHPNSPSLLFALGNQYAAQARWNEAQQLYAQAYQFAPSDARLIFNLAISMEHQGQTPLAARYYLRAVALDGDHQAGFDHDAITRHAKQLEP